MWLALGWMACTGSAPETPDTGVQGEPLVEVEGCEGAQRLQTGDDPSARGPWPVGTRTASVGRLTVQLWYPAVPGSDVGLPLQSVDIRYALPESQQQLIPDTEAPDHVCDCVADLPVDARGPFPVVVFVHGTAAWRSQSQSVVTHWASRGFVVVAADHPGLWLADALSLVCPDEPTGDADLTGDVDAMLAALAAASGDLAFLEGSLDLERVAVTGHSAGGSVAAELADRPGVQVVIPMAAGTPPVLSTTLQSTLFLGGLDDAVVAFDATRSGYEATEGAKRLVGLDRAGHLAFSDICAITNDAGLDILTIATQAGVCGAALAGLLFDCDPAFLDGPTASALVNHATTAVLETELACIDRDPSWIALAADPDVAVLEESP